MNIEKKRLVVADDEMNILSALKDILAENYTVFTASDGAEALGLVRKYMPDLALLDIMMPGMDGFEVCKRIKMDPLTRNVPVVFLTAKTHTEDAEQGFKSGAEAFVAKPFSAEKLIEKIRSVIEKAEIRKTI
jgi:CheY-like chemotaxis protein